MLKLQNFTGINNVLAAEELEPNALQSATNVDLDLAGRARRRAGHTQAAATAHKNIHLANGFTLATRGAAGDLVNVDEDIVLLAALGHSPRVWYSPLPDGRTLFGNGTTQGVISADGTTRSTWGVPIPSSAGAAANAAGLLHAGEYQWSLTHVRDADGAESGPVYSNATVVVSTGGVAFTGLPVLAGYSTRVYLTSHYGGERFLAGETSGATLTFSDANKDLVAPCRTEHLKPPPAGKLLAFWRGRAIVAVGPALFASKPFSWELFDLRRDFKHLGADITLVQPVDGGIWAGTTRELVFLAGSTWDGLTRIVKMRGSVVLGSGCAVKGEHLKMGDGRAQGDCMVGIAGGWIVGGTPDGSLIPLTVDRYKTEVTEVASCFRVVDGIPQYIALPQ